jgi:hypothetical protein
MNPTFLVDKCVEDWICLGPSLPPGGYYGPKICVASISLGQQLHQLHLFSHKKCLGEQKQGELFDSSLPMKAQWLLYVLPSLILKYCLFVLLQ